MQLSRRFLVVAVTVAAVACTSQTGEPNDRPGQSESWTQTAEEWQSGIAIGAIPAGMTLATNVGNEVSVAHRFEDGDGRRLEVFRLLDPERFPAQGEVLETANGISYQQTEGGGRREVFFETQGVRLGASSSELTFEEFLAIAKSITYDPGADQLSG